MKRHAVSAQIESEDVEADNVRKTGERAMRARNTKIDDFKALLPLKKKVETSERQAQFKYDSLTLIPIKRSAKYVALHELPYEESGGKHEDGDPDQSTRVPCLIIEMYERGQKYENRGNMLCDSARRQCKRPIGIFAKID